MLYVPAMRVHYPSLCSTCKISVVDFTLVNRKSSVKELIFSNLSEVHFCRIQKIKGIRAESEHSTLMSTAQVCLAGKANTASSKSELFFFQLRANLWQTLAAAVVLLTVMIFLFSNDRKYVWYFQICFPLGQRSFHTFHK